MKTDIDISFKRINKLAIPAIIAGIAEPLLSTTDLIIIGNIGTNSKESIAAIGIVGAFISMIIWVFGQSRSAMSSIISQYLGASKLDEIKEFPIQVIFLIITFGTAVSCLCYPFIENILQFYNASGLILEYAVEYYKIRILGFPFTLFVIIVFGIFRGLQNTKYTMFVALIGTAVNIILDFILVYGIEGYIPPLHLEGAAYASLIAQLIMAIISLYLLIKKTKITLQLKFPFHKKIKKFILMMFNLFIRSLSINLALYLSTSYATKFGDENIAAYTIGFNIWLICAFIIDGYSSAGNILAGKLYGANETNTLHQLGKKLIQYGIVFGSILTIFGIIFYRLIGSFFTQNSEVLEVFYESFWVILLMQPLCAVAFIYDGIFKGLGKMHVLRNILLLTTLSVFVPTLIILDYYEWKNYAIWMAFFTWITARAIPLVLIFNKKFKLKN